MEKLEIFREPEYSDAIIKEENYIFYPAADNFNLNDEIRIPIRNQDLYTVPGESYIYIEGNFNVKEGTGECVLTNNAYAFLFDQVRYELNGIEIDRCNMPGITCTMKALASYNAGESKALQMAGWNPLGLDQPTRSKNNFSASIPLKYMLGFAEDYRKIIINVAQELVLVRSRTDENCYKNNDPKGTKRATLEITKIEWRMPRVVVNSPTYLNFLNILKKEEPIKLAFRKWDLHVLPTLRQSKSDIWSVRTTNNLEKPRYVIIAFQTNKKDNPIVDGSDFNHASIRNIKLYLNSDIYPYGNMNLQMDVKRYAEAYRMYALFQPSYYGKLCEPLVGYEEFYKYPIYVVDCSKQNESVKSSTVDIKLELEAEKPFEENTTGYCLILHDTEFMYTPFNGRVDKVIE